VPAGTYVSRVEPSGRDTAVFYVTFDNHRRGDFRPYVYMTRDGGRSFRSIAAGLPAGGPNFVHVIREDPVNPDLLYVGTDVGVYVSMDRGGSWRPFMAGLPTVPVHDLKVHPRDRELIAGTHGRSIWIADVAPLQELTPAKLAQAVTVFTPKTAYQYGEHPMEGQSVGQQYWAAPSPAYGAEIVYRVAAGTQVQGPAAWPSSDRSATRSARSRTRRARRACTGCCGTCAAAPPAHAVAGREARLGGERAPHGRGDRLAGRREGGPGADGRADQAGAHRRAAGDGSAHERVRWWWRRRSGPSRDGRRGRNAALRRAAGRERRRGGAGGGAARSEGAQSESTAGEAGASMDQGVLSQVFQAVQAATRRTGGAFGGRGGGAGFVPTGTYQVVVTINGQTTRVPLRVERVSGGDGAGPLFGGDDDEREP
jgi:hypothetical protein